MNIQPYNEGDHDIWDFFVKDAVNGTFLHTRRYLSYHGARFRDRSLILVEASRVVAVFPAAEDPRDPTGIISHPGITYGGLVHQGTLCGETLIEALGLCIAYYRDLGYRWLRYKVVPSIYHQRLLADDSYALFRAGGHLWRRDLCAVIDHHAQRRLHRNRRQGVDRARRHGVSVSFDPIHFDAFWNILEEQLEFRYRVRPVHSRSEMTTLMERFPDHIHLATALYENTVVAGLILYQTSVATRAQYSAAGDVARRISALDLVFETAIMDSAQTGRRYFDFGNSNESDGRVLNEGLYRYKMGFGAGSVVQDFWEISLDNSEVPVNSAGHA
ncbi:MAG: GNAT family N-acetyltransferase [Firmicutes bacterium]|nr:GNAT family N-acetyltransferase [Bacillota bacterium]